MTISLRSAILFTITLHSHFITTVSTLGTRCYICTGLNCAPHSTHLTSCKSKVGPDTIKCFFVAIDLDNIYRGCYEPNGTYVEFCNKHRLNYCQICQGQACNNHPIFTDTPFSCRQCLQGRCHYTDEPDRSTFKTCTPFFYGHVPRCFVYYYYGRLHYFFGCANALPLAIRSSCEADTFNTVCRYCDYPNCNDGYFANFQMIPHYRFVCLSSITGSYINCNVYSKQVPVMGCFFNEAGQEPYWGCLSDFSYVEYGQVVDREHLRICNDNQRCNNANRDVHNQCVKNFDGQTYPTGTCAMRNALCMINKWVDELGLTREDRHCSTRVDCLHPEECFYCDKSHSAEKACNKVALTANVYNCYYCDSPNGACSTVNPATANRTHLCTDAKRRCFTHLNKVGSVVRGCFFDTGRSSSSLRKPSSQRDCAGDLENCDICQGALCNSRPTQMYCYICSATNTLCQYDQLHQAISRCPGRDVIRSKWGCYTVVRPDGLVERGCWTGEFKCPSPDSQCIVCGEIGCNNGTYHSGLCLECKGPAKGDCGDGFEFLATESISRPCPVYVDHPLCYVAYTEQNGVVERGCTATNQYLAWMEPVCSRGMMNCTFCNGNNCNYWRLDPYVD